MFTTMRDLTTEGTYTFKELCKFWKKVEYNTKINWEDKKEIRKWAIAYSIIYFLENCSGKTPQKLFEQVKKIVSPLDAGLFFSILIKLKKEKIISSIRCLDTTYYYIERK